MAKTVTVLFVGEDGSGRLLLKEKIKKCMKDFNPHETDEHFEVNGKPITKGHTLSFSTDIVVNKLVKAMEERQQHKQTSKKEDKSETATSNTNR